MRGLRNFSNKKVILHKVARPLRGFLRRNRFARASNMLKLGLLTLFLAGCSLSPLDILPRELQPDYHRRKREREDFDRRNAAANRNNVFHYNPPFQIYVFACNSFQDLDHNKRALYPTEFINIKNTFSYNEPLSLFLYDESNTKAKFQAYIFDSKGNKVKEIVKNSSGAIRESGDKAGELLGSGKFSIRWYKNNVHVGSHEIEIRPDSSPL